MFKLNMFKLQHFNGHSRNVIEYSNTINLFIGLIVVNSFLWDINPETKRIWEGILTVLNKCWTGYCIVNKYLFKFYIKDTRGTCVDVVLVSFLLVLNKCLPTVFVLFRNTSGGKVNDTRGQWWNCDEEIKTV